MGRSVRFHAHFFNCPTKGPIWGDDSVDLRFVVLHGELRSKHEALDVFLSLMTGATLKCKQFSCVKGKN